MAGSLEGNKLIAAVLTAGIVGVGSAVFAGILYHPHQLEEPVYRVEAAATEGGGEAAPAAEAQPIGVLLASASVGERREGGQEVRRLPQLRQGRRQQGRPEPVGRGQPPDRRARGLQLLRRRWPTRAASPGTTITSTSS